MTACPQAILEVALQHGGRLFRGFAGDCLPPGWFDKSPGVPYRRQIADLLAATAAAQRAFAEEARKPNLFFDAWLAAYRRIMEPAPAAGVHPLVASFGLSLVERAVLDALARAAGLSFRQAIEHNIYGIRPGQVHPELEAYEPKHWLPHEPSRSIYVRHTVGLIDPLTASDINPGEQLSDGFPQAVEEYLDRVGLRYFKVKLSNQLEHDRRRLVAFAQLVESRRGTHYRLTLDGNELYRREEDFAALVEMLSSEPALKTLWENTLAIEQPLHRDIALDAVHTSAVRAACRHKVIIIDESDATLWSYSQALDVGYRGTSSKNCKGPIKSILNAGLTWLRNGCAASGRYLMTGEDLCCVGVVPMQSDLCLAAALGLESVERNGHHYHRGLSYLPADEQQAALASHGDLYAWQHGVVAPWVRDGRFEISSLQCPGFGFSTVPDVGRMESPEAWRFESLGIAEGEA